MLEKSNQNIILKAISLLGLALLLMLSPCKVRNFIQEELGIPQTEISNKNKTTFSQTCSDSDTSIELTVKEKQTKQRLFAEFKPFEAVLIITDFHEEPSSLTQTLFHRVSHIPFYILYQNFKDYL
ncbi:hypothetical protein [Aestuariibaculum lutulentum]|uniref:Uncharacterized protein n=1 Tax=Aestuariibaculum lutulentum TaxID=2920935 RepID=A0ABS9RKB2_9FLAO|nr:hypothetical protein [Aestuariibaculum lutulentum]MCH4553398.1 hypothetical protein [Aestuariibaculum lutulentum]